MSPVLKIGFTNLRKYIRKIFGDFPNGNLDSKLYRSGRQPVFLKLKGYQAGLYTLLIALGVAMFGFGMPAGMAVSSALYGFAYGLWPIAWIIVTAVFLYKITVKTGQFDIIRASVISITEDQRLQMLLVGFSFGAFLEGAAGFGAPVAICV